MATIKIMGQAKVKTIKGIFRKKMGVDIEIYDQEGNPAPDDVSLGSIRTQSPKSTELKIVGNSKVRTVEKYFEDNYGVKVDILNPDGVLSDNDATLGDIRRLYAAVSKKEIVYDDIETKKATTKISFKDLLKFNYLRIEISPNESDPCRMQIHDFIELGVLECNTINDMEEPELTGQLIYSDTLPHILLPKDRNIKSLKLIVRKEDIDEEVDVEVSTFIAWQLRKMSVENLIRFRNDYELPFFPEEESGSDYEEYIKEQESPFEHYVLFFQNPEKWIREEYCSSNEVDFDPSMLLKIDLDEICFRFGKELWDPSPFNNHVLSYLTDIESIDSEENNVIELMRDHWKEAVITGVRWNMSDGFGTFENPMHLVLDNLEQDGEVPGFQHDFDIDALGWNDTNYTFIARSDSWEDWEVPEEYQEEAV